jgi:hypothetical protein
MNSEIYSLEDKKKLVKRIENIKCKKHHCEIYKIIKSDNINKINKKMKNNNGIFIFFNTLQNDTYKKLEEYINQIKKKNTDSASDSYIEYIPYSPTNYPFENDFKLKYSNQEKNLIKKKIYTNTINNYNELNEN